MIKYTCVELCCCSLQYCTARTFSHAYSHNLVTLKHTTTRRENFNTHFEHMTIAVLCKIIHDDGGHFNIILQNIP
jgi:hypothetical protein